MDHKDATHGHTLTLEVNPMRLHDRETYTVKELYEAAGKIGTTETLSQTLIQAAVTKEKREKAEEY